MATILLLSAAQGASLFDCVFGTKQRGKCWKTLSRSCFTATLSLRSFRTQLKIAHYREIWEQPQALEEMYRPISTILGACRPLIFDL